MSSAALLVDVAQTYLAAYTFPYPKTWGSISSPEYSQPRNDPKMPPSAFVLMASRENMCDKDE